MVQVFAALVGGGVGEEPLRLWSNGHNRVGLGGKRRREGVVTMAVSTSAVSWLAS